MKTLARVLLFSAAVQQFGHSVHAQINSSRVEELVCRQYKSWCANTGQRVTIPSRGQGNQQASANIDEIEEIVSKRVNETLEALGFGRVLSAVTVGSGGIPETDTNRENWTVFQRRVYSSGFDYGWRNYANGFGYTYSNYWMGLYKLYLKTKKGDHEMRIDMIETGGNHFYAHYESFIVGPHTDGYRLNVSGYSGNAGDGLAFHNLQRFSTKDMDHDNDEGNCASIWDSGWWFNNCFESNLNGIYGGTGYEGIYWKGRNLRFTEMKFRKKATHEL